MANETTENELNQTGEPGTEYFMETLPGQDRYVAPLDETPLQGEPCAATRCSSSPAC